MMGEERTMSESGATAPVSRRRLLRWVAGGLGAVVVAGVGGFELVEHGVLPGKLQLDELAGACSVNAPDVSFGALGTTTSGQFFSKARRRRVGYSIGYPAGYQSNDALALIVMLHGYGNNHRNALVNMTPAQAVALRFGAAAPRPAALVTVDGGNGYWNPHPTDDPMAMVVDELIPLCQRLGLGRTPETISLMGISMGGYGALAIAERNPGLASGVAAISPAIWTSYDQARAANRGAFASASAFEEGDVIARAATLRGVSIRIASGNDDPFHSGVEKLAGVLPHSSTVVFSSGCHTNPFFYEQEPPSLQFLSTVQAA
jgi:pimeloyl-ACP methyl ester carboxylesterase